MNLKPSTDLTELIIIEDWLKRNKAIDQQQQYLIINSEIPEQEDEYDDFSR